MWERFFRLVFYQCGSFSLGFSKVNSASRTIWGNGIEGNNKTKEAMSHVFCWSGYQKVWFVDSAKEMPWKWQCEIQPITSIWKWIPLIEDDIYAVFLNSDLNNNEQLTSVWMLFTQFFCMTNRRVVFELNNLQNIFSKIVRISLYFTDSFFQLVIVYIIKFHVIR